VADLYVSKTHTGKFTAGDVGETFLIIVSNIGAGATVGEVTVKDILPAGLMATAMVGDGWQVDLATLTATRSDALAPGASYPALTLTVDVSDNASRKVTNKAIVSGGGEVNTANDLAKDRVKIAGALIHDKRDNHDHERKGHHRSSDHDDDHDRHHIKSRTGWHHGTRHWAWNS